MRGEWDWRVLKRRPGRTFRTVGRSPASPGQLIGAVVTHLTELIELSLLAPGPDALPACARRG